MKIEGYKCFDLDENGNIVNRYGMVFQVGQDYHVDGEIKFGNYGNGFHMCKWFEDTFRYFKCSEETYGKPNGFVLCKVVGSGDAVRYDDEYYGFYNMYAVRNIKIVSIVTKEELKEMVDNLSDERFKRFIQLFSLNADMYEDYKSKKEGIPHLVKHIQYYKEHYNKSDNED